MPSPHNPEAIHLNHHRPRLVHRHSRSVAAPACASTASRPVAPKKRVFVALAKTKHEPQRVLARDAKTQFPPKRFLLKFTKNRLWQGLLAHPAKPRSKTFGSLLPSTGTPATMHGGHASAQRLPQGPCPPKKEFYQRSPKLGMSPNEF